MEEQDEQPVPRRLAGIDLGIASRHAVRVLEADGRLVCRASCVPSVESLAAVERAALAGASPTWLSWSTTATPARSWPQARRTSPG